MTALSSPEAWTATAVRAELPPSEHYQLNWRGIEVGIVYRADAGFSEGYAHLEIHTAPRTLLPITETGYRSHFLPKAEMDRVGCPVAYVSLWLDKAAQSKAWRQMEADLRQGQLL